VDTRLWNAVSAQIARASHKWHNITLYMSALTKQKCVIRSTIVVQNLFGSRFHSIQFQTHVQPTTVRMCGTKWAIATASNNVALNTDTKCIQMDGGKKPGSKRFQNTKAKQRLPQNNAFLAKVAPQPLHICV
jgi:hypothetical protein